MSELTRTQVRYVEERRLVCLNLARYLYPSATLDQQFDAAGSFFGFIGADGLTAGLPLTALKMAAADLPAASPAAIISRASIISGFLSRDASPEPHRSREDG